MLRLLSSTTALALLSTVSFAADLPLPPEPIPEMIVPVFSWTGFYVGVSGGYAWGDYSYDFDPPDVGSDLEGWVAGGQAGYNWQSGMFVFGGVADIAWSDIEGDSACPNPAFTCDASVEWFGTARANLGLAFDRFMVYGTGGFAYGEMERESVSPGGITLTDENLHIGWAAGGGGAFAVTNNIVLGAEALWVNLEDETYDAAPPLFSEVEIGSDFVVVRGSANFKF